ncbi:MAG: hypothetical protein FWC68_06625 [Oscillospiraceae bacterium]|nr:hypothetical protein [Oscillospiraceae bacterium]
MTKQIRLITVLTLALCLISTVVFADLEGREIETGEGYQNIMTTMGEIDIVGELGEDDITEDTREGAYIPEEYRRGLDIDPIMGEIEPVSDDLDDEDGANTTLWIAVGAGALVLAVVVVLVLKKK